MSKNQINTQKNAQKTGHKRSNSNSYNANLMSNMTPVINTSSTNTNVINQMNQTNEKNSNTISNIGNQTMNYNLFNQNNESIIEKTNITNLKNNTNNLISQNNSNQTNSSNSEEFKSLTQKIDCVGKVPTARFGHTLVLVSPVKIILFGGAVGDTRNFQFTNDTYVLNLITKIWLKLEVSGVTTPCPRAAHAACSNDNLQMVVYGGSTGNGSLAVNDLYILDHKAKDEDANWSSWSIIPTTGPSPGKRYGHTLNYMKPYIVLFGGNTGSQPANDTWILNLDKSPFTWTKLEISEDSAPLARLYHASGLCTKGNAQGMMIIFGGRDGAENALNDSWGLRRHRNGSWDWVMAPNKSDVQPKPRYNHSIIFVGSIMVITGGRGRSIQEILPTEIYDTEVSEWKKFQGMGLYRHSAFIKESFLYIYGGFENSNPNYPIDKLIKIDLLEYFSSNQLLVSKIGEYINNSNPSAILSKPNKDKENTNNSNISNILLKNTSIDNNVKQEQKFRLASQAVVVKLNENSFDEMGLIRKVSIDKLNDEAKRIGYHNIRSQVNPRRMYNEDLINKFIDTLLRPFDWYTSEVEELHKNLPFTIEEVDSLIIEAARVIPRDQTLVRIRSPAKIFGNLYGQYNDLMRFFESYGHPSDDYTMGDIHLLQYVFLGDFCDRGNHSLEVILLLLALKVRYPDHIYIIRGHHEDIAVNTVHGLGEECEKRLEDNIRSDNSIFIKLNALFELLPLSVLIDNKILCMHGGIGSSVSKLLDISSIKRPIQVVQDVRTHEQQVLLDILWSEYSDDVNELAINEERDIVKSGFILKYGKDRLNKFLSDNKLVLLITAHQWVAEGIKLFNNDKLLTVMSASNYMDKFNNIGGMVYITRNSGQIIPKLIDVYKNEKKNYKPSKNISPVRKIK